MLATAVRITKHILAGLDDLVEVVISTNELVLVLPFG